MAWHTAPSGVTCLAAYDAVGAASLADSYTNEANPGTYTAAPGTAPSWAYGTGWTFNGSTQYLTTGGVVPAAGWSAVVRFSSLGSPGSNAPVLGAGNNGAGNAFQLVPYAAVTGSVRLYAYGTNFLIASANVSSGTLAMVGGGNSYYNAASDGATPGTFSGAGQALYIGARNNGGTADRFCPVSIQAVAIYSGALTSGDVSAIVAAMNALPAATSAPTMMQHHAAMLARG